LNSLLETRALRRLALLIFLALGSHPVHAGGDEVVVIYNARVPESKLVAEHYAAARQVPQSQVFSFELTTNEVISRGEFNEHFKDPLIEKLEATGLWKFGPLHFPATNGHPAYSETRVVTSKIRYAVLCYGVPLKIAPSPTLDEPAEKMVQKEFRVNEAAVDSELAWLPVSKLNVPLTGPLPNPFYLMTNSWALNCTNGILLVARLDGPTFKIANGLVDKALAAESNGFWGRAYFDTRGLPTTNIYFQGDQWLLTAAEICRQQGFDVQTDTNSDTWNDTFPMSHIAVYAGWYAGWANGPFLNDKVEFMPGAFAYHLHSFSADSIRTTNHNWVGPLLARGATCTLGCVYEPYLAFTPNIAFLVQQLCVGYTFGEAAWASQLALSWQNTVVGDPLYQPFKMPPAERHAQLARTKNPLLEWSFNRLVNLDLARGIRAPQLAQFLEQIPQTTSSAVLTEKLAELYDAQGKPSSAIDAWQRALTLQPSVQQRIRIRRLLTEKLLVAERVTEAAENIRRAIKEAPTFADAPKLRVQLQALEQKIAAAKKK
jgi:uncharacterized protein (TIGR03790 family)